MPIVETLEELKQIVKTRKIRPCDLSSADFVNLWVIGHHSDAEIASIIQANPHTIQLRRQNLGVLIDVVDTYNKYGLFETYDHIRAIQKRRKIKE